MIVVDCAAVVDLLSGSSHSSALQSELAQADLHAPSLLDFEVVSALRGMVLGRKIALTRAEDLMSDFDLLPIERWSGNAALRRRAFSLRHNLSAYDAAYVALAEALQCPLVTRDARLAHSAGHQVEIRVPAP